MPRLIQLNLFLFGALVLCPMMARAQGDAMTELYGTGVHLYFAGDYQNADLVLTRVVDAGSQDPRVHYFRGLAREHLGGDSEFDFATGAQLEAEGARVVSVGSALSRIQGAVRSKIEKARRDARVENRLKQMMQEDARRKMIPQPSVVPDAAPPPPAEVDDPFAGDGLRSNESVAQPAQPTVPDTEVNPFSDEPAPATGTNPADNPFGDSPADNPFGDPPAGDNPFDAPSDAPATDNPFGNPATEPSGASDIENPFGF
ncbi:MAG: hypothetical protein KDB22_13190 [Planctomycetales bacterium]|nr:hypothetical protein [Planctomycetales bacterium]